MIDHFDLADDPFQATQLDPSIRIFKERESNVRSYCRAFPTTFTNARGARLEDERGRTYIDFFAAAGSLNYGHNHPRMKDALVDYILQDGISQGLDMYTGAKRSFLETFTERVLEPRHLNHRVQFVGPTGTNAVEAALKIARKATGRSNVIAFMGAYHGNSLGSLAATSNRAHRGAPALHLNDITFVPFPAQQGPMADVDSIAFLRHVLTDSHSGVDLPAAVILETVQAEGGVNVAPVEWLIALRNLCDELDIVMIVDEIQTGCGRTGPFFSFERAGIVPDVIAVSKSISGYGLPMALTLVRPELDCWMPGEHTGTFRGNQLAFVTATCALEIFDSVVFQAQLAMNASELLDTLVRDIAPIDERIEFRGLGMLWGIDLSGIDSTGGLTAEVARRCFDDGLIIESAGHNSSVLKLLAPLNIEPDQLSDGLSILLGALQKYLH